MTCGILVPQLGIEPMPSAVEGPSSNHSTATVIPWCTCFIQHSRVKQSDHLGEYMNYQQPVYLLVFSLLLQIPEAKTIPHKINFMTVMQMATGPHIQDPKFISLDKLKHSIEKWNYGVFPPFISGSLSVVNICPCHSVKCESLWSVVLQAASCWSSL